MDKQTLSHYGWIIVMILTLSVMLAFATPLGKYVGRGVSNFAIAMGIINDGAVEEDNIEKLGDEWEDYLNSNKPSSKPPIEKTSGGVYTGGIYVGQYQGWETINVAVVFYNNGTLEWFESDPSDSTFDGVQGYVHGTGRFSIQAPVTYTYDAGSNQIADEYGYYDILDDGKTLFYEASDESFSLTLRFDETQYEKPAQYEYKYVCIRTGEWAILHEDNTMTYCGWDGEIVTINVQWLSPHCIKSIGDGPLLYISVEGEMMLLPER